MAKKRIFTPEELQKGIAEYYNLLANPNLLPEKLREKKLRKIRRTPEINPDSIINRKYLVTGHKGGRGFVLYHGNNINVAETHLNWTGFAAPEKRKPGYTRTVVKLWESVKVKVGA